MATYQDFFSAVLSGLGIPVTQGALEGFATVVNEEGANTYNNPMNIEWHPGQNQAWKGSGNFNSVGVQEYATPQDGINATIAFLKDNSGWAGLLGALKTGTYSEIVNAWGNEYTWASYRSGSQANAQAILAKQAGNGTVTATTTADDTSSSTGDDLTAGGLVGTLAGAASGGLTGLFGSAFGSAASIPAGIEDVAKSLGVMAEVANKVLWIFNVDHFIKFQLYIWGFTLLLGGLLFLIFSAKGS